MQLAIMIGVAYCLMAGLQLLPERTRPQRLGSAGGNLIMLAVFLAFIVMMLKLTRQRRLRKPERLSRPVEPEPPTET